VPDSGVVATDGATKQALASMLTIARFAFESSANRALATAGLGPNEVVQRRTDEDNEELFAQETQQDFMRFSRFSMLAVSVEQRLQAKDHQKIKRSIEKHGTISPAVWSCKDPGAATEEKEKRTSLGGGTNIVHDESESPDAARSGIVLKRVVAALAAIGQKPVVPIEGNALAFTRAQYGRVANEDGDQVTWYVHWSDLMPYFYFLIGVSGACNNHAIEARA